MLTEKVGQGCNLLAKLWMIISTMKIYGHMRICRLKKRGSQGKGIKSAVFQRSQRKGEEGIQKLMTILCHFGN